MITIKKTSNDNHREKDKKLLKMVNYKIYVFFYDINSVIIGAKTRPWGIPKMDITSTESVTRMTYFINDIKHEDLITRVIRTHFFLIVKQKVFYCINQGLGFIDPTSMFLGKRKNFLSELCFRPFHIQVTPLHLLLN